MTKELKHKLYSSTECLSEQTMFDCIDNKLSAKERHLVEKHMLDCELCSDAMEGLELVKDRNRISVIKTNAAKFITPIAEKEAKIISINYKTVFSIAAGIALLIGGVFLFKNFTSSEMKSSDVAEMLPPKDQSPAPPPVKETEEAPALSANDSQQAIADEREQGPQTKSLVLKDKEGQLESAEDLKQNIALGEAKEQNTNGTFKTIASTGSATTAPGNKGTPYTWTRDKASNGEKLDDAIAKQEGDRAKEDTPMETEVSIPLGGAGESNKDITVDETKKAEEKTVAHNNITLSPSAVYANQTTTPAQSQEQKNDKSNVDSDQMALAKKSEKGGKYRSDPDTKGKDKGKKIDANKNNEEVSGKVAYEPQSISAVSDNEVPQKQPPVTTVTTENAATDGLAFYDSISVNQEKMPEYPGGSVAMKKFIHDNFKYSKLSGSDGTKIFVQFTVDKDGSIKNPKIIKGISSDLNKEALRVINAMPKWIPVKQNGKPVSVLLNLPIQLEIK